MQPNIYQQIHELINESGLSDVQKREFAEVFARTKEDALKPVLKLFKSDAKWIERLYDNYADKKRAYVTGSISEWRHIVEKEKAQIAK